MWGLEVKVKDTGLETRFADDGSKREQGRGGGGGWRRRPGPSGTGVQRSRKVDRPDSEVYHPGTTEQGTGSKRGEDSREGGDVGKEGRPTDRPTENYDRERRRVRKRRGRGTRGRVRRPRTSQERE